MGRAGSHSSSCVVAPVFVFDTGTQAAKTELERYKQQQQQQGSTRSGLQWSCVSDRQLHE
jgi:hypothetical protein